jgi:hypothetical protein
METGGTRLVAAARKLLNKRTELKVTAVNQGCSVEALADGDLTKLEGHYALQLFLVRQLEWSMREGNFKPVDPCEMLRNSKKSHTNKRKAPEKKRRCWKQDHPSFTLFGIIVHRAYEPV